MGKKVLVHEKPVALGIFRAEAFVFVQIYGLYLGEIQIAFPAPRSQLLVSAYRGGAGGQTQYAVGF